MHDDDARIAGTDFSNSARARSIWPRVKCPMIERSRMFHVSVWRLTLVMVFRPTNVAPAMRSTARDSDMYARYLAYIRFGSPKAQRSKPPRDIVIAWNDDGLATFSALRMNSRAR